MATLRLTSRMLLICASVLLTGGFLTPVFAEEPAAAAPVAVAEAVPVPDLTGSWSGRWVSCTNGHNGPMNATFCRLNATQYEVRFNGRFFKLIPFKYTAVLNVTAVEPGRVYLTGSHRLGPVLGTFSYNAWATDSQFVAGYASEKDQGQFIMNRVSR